MDRDFKSCLDALEELGVECRVSSYLTPASPILKFANVLVMTDEMERTLRTSPAAELLEHLVRVLAIEVPSHTAS